MQGILIGTRVMAPGGLKMTATKFLPFSQFGQHLSTLINCYLHTGQDETIIGWCLILDRECPLPKLVTSYFNTFHRYLVRVMIANCKIKETVVDELVDFLSPLVGLITVRDVDNLTREFCGFRLETTAERVSSLLQEQCIKDLDLINGAYAINLPYYRELDGVSVGALNELMDQLRAEELESPEVVPNIEDGLAKRKTRRRRHSTLLSEEITSPKKRSPQVTPMPVEIISACPSEFLETISSKPSLFDDLELDHSLGMKEERLRAIHQKHFNLADRYEVECKEYELLMLIYKVLSQPDEAIMRKLNIIEDYEDRLKKLGAKLRHSLSPEDLLRTLASISS